MLFRSLGTTRALTADSQLPTAVWTDDAWGNVLSATDPAATPHQYVGRYGYYANGTSGLMLLTQRYYDGGVGRFVSEDGIRHGSDWYLYVPANPNTSVDPVGLTPGPLTDDQWKTVSCTLAAVCGCMHGRPCRLRLPCYTFVTYPVHICRGVHDRDNFHYDPDYEEFAGTTWPYGPFSCHFTFGTATDFSDLDELADTLIHEYTHCSIGFYGNINVDRCCGPVAVNEQMYDQAAAACYARHRDCIRSRVAQCLQQPFPTCHAWSFVTTPGGTPTCYEYQAVGASCPPGAYAGPCPG